MQVIVDLFWFPWKQLCIKSHRDFEIQLGCSLQIDALTKSSSRINRIDYSIVEAVLDSMGLEHSANLHCVKEHSSTFSGFSLLMLIISVKYMRLTEPSISERVFLVS